MVNKLVDIFDESNKSIKIQKMLKEAHKEGLWHRVAHVWIYNSKGEVLLQKRYRKKKLYPDLWDVSMQVHVSANELPIVTAVKAMQDKLGIYAEKSRLSLICIRKNITHYEDINNREYFYSYAFKYEGKIENLKMKPDRMSSLEFSPISKIKKELKMTTGKYTPRGDYWDLILNNLSQKIILEKKNTNTVISDNQNNTKKILINDRRKNTLQNENKVKSLDFSDRRKN